MRFFTNRRIAGNDNMTFEITPSPKVTFPVTQQNGPIVTSAPSFTLSSTIADL